MEALGHSDGDGWWAVLDAKRHASKLLKLGLQLYGNEMGGFRVGFWL
jgi:hypothetical protein